MKLKHTHIHFSIMNTEYVPICYSRERVRTEGQGIKKVDLLSNTDMCPYTNKIKVNETYMVTTEGYV